MSCYLPCNWISEGHSEQSTLSLNFSLGPTEAVHPGPVNWFGKLEYAFNIWIELDTLNRRRPSPLSIPLTSYHPIESISLFIAVPTIWLSALLIPLHSPSFEYIAHRWYDDNRNGWNGQRNTEKLSAVVWTENWMMGSLLSSLCNTIRPFRF